MVAKWWIRLFILFRFICSNHPAILVPNDSPEYWFQDGDLLIGYLANVHGPGEGEKLCSDEVSQEGVHLTEAVAFAVREVNRNREILPNITLGFVMVDGCRSPQTALARSVYFLQDNGDQIESIKEPPFSNDTNNGTGADVSRQRHFGVVGVVGPGMSAQAVPVARLLSVFEMPMISTSATSDELSDSQAFQYFLRLSPADEHVVEAIVQTTAHFKWEYVVLLSSSGQWSTISESIKRRLGQVEICTAFSHTLLHANETDFVIENLIDFDKANVIVSTLNKGDLQAMQSALGRVGILKKYLWVIGYPDDQLHGVESIPEYSLLIKPLSALIPRFNEYFRLRNPWTLPENPWLKTLWQEGFDCTFPEGANQNRSLCQSTGNIKKMPGYIPPQTSTDLSRIHSAVHAFAAAIHRQITSACPHVFRQTSEAKSCVDGAQLHSYLLSTNHIGLNGRVSFDEEGEAKTKLILDEVTRHGDGFKEKQIGSYSTDTRRLTIDFSTHNLSIARRHTNPMFASMCRDICPARHISVRDALPCCWTCASCQENEVVVDNGTAHCQPCPMLLWPDEDGRKCRSISPSHLEWTSLYELTILGIVLLEAVTLVVMALVVVAHSEHKLVKSTGFGLNLLIIIGALVACSSIPLLTREPTQLICVLQKVTFHLGCNAIFATLLIRVVFLRFSVAAAGPTLISTRSTSLQASISMGLILIQGCALFCTEYFLATTIEYSMPERLAAFVEVYCQENLFSSVAHVSYNGAFVLVACFMSLSLRTTIHNFREATFTRITTALLSLLYGGITFLYFYLERFDLRSYALSIFILAAVAALLIVYLCPRLYAICCKDPNHLAVITMANPSITPAPAITRSNGTLPTAATV